MPSQIISCGLAVSTGYAPALARPPCAGPPPIMRLPMEQHFLVEEERGGEGRRGEERQGERTGGRDGKGCEGVENVCSYVVEMSAPLNKCHGRA